LLALGGFGLFLSGCAIPNSDSSLDSLSSANEASGNYEAGAEEESPANDGKRDLASWIGQPYNASTLALGVPPPKIIVPPRPLNCVPYARNASGIPIRGNAGTWWRRAYGKFRRGKTPDVGAVLVMRQTRRNKFGHIAVVTEVLNKREIVVDHANWLNRRRIHIGTPVRDVSPNNDWSSVRVWYTPGNRYGAGIYPMYGFIYPEPSQLFTTVQNANVRQAPSTKSARITTLPMRTEVEVVEQITGASWYRIARRGRVLGYVFAPLIKPLT